MGLLENRVLDDWYVMGDVAVLDERVKGIVYSRCSHPTPTVYAGNKCGTRCPFL
jgi:hypothetical protein